MKAFRDFFFYGCAIILTAIALLAIYSKPFSIKHIVQFLGLGAVAYAMFKHNRWMSPLWGGMVVITIFPAVLAIYSAEMYFAYVANTPVKVTHDPGFDGRTMKEVVNDLRQRGDIRAVPVVYPSLVATRPDLFPDRQYLIDGQPLLPLGAISNRTTVLCNESGYWATYQSDEHGFNNPKGIWGGGVDIAVIGDSFSQGNCVRSGRGWVDLLRGRYSRTLNLGMGGNGPLFEFATLKEFVSEIKPKIVLWEYFEANDTRMQAEESIPILKSYLTEKHFRQNLLGKQSRIDECLEQTVKEAEAPRPEGEKNYAPLVASVLRLTNLRIRLGLVKRNNPNLSSLSEMMGEADRLVSGWGGKLYLVYLPSASGLSSNDLPLYGSHDEIIAIARQHGIAVIDLYPIFKREKDPLSYFPYRGPFHYNEDGYRMVAEKVIKELSSKSSDLN